MAIYHVFTQHACVFAHYKSIESEYSYNAQSNITLGYAKRFNIQCDESSCC